MLTDEERREEVTHFMKVVDAFRQYGPNAISANTRRRRDWYRIPKEDRELLENIGWKTRLDTVDDLILENAKVLNRIVDNPAIFMDDEELLLAEDGKVIIESAQETRANVSPRVEHEHHRQAHSEVHHYHEDEQTAPNHSHSHSHSPSELSHSHHEPKKRQVSPVDIDKVRSTLKQFVRDWSEEGRIERDQCYKPMIEALLNHFPDDSTRKTRRVSIPGAGLARLGWEVAFLGFETQCNEFSHYMLLPSYYVLNETKHVNQHTIYPFIHSLSNIVGSESLLRGISFPDILPSSLPPGSNFSMVAGDFEQLFGVKEHPEEDEAGKWDAVMTCFFIDTAKNIVNYLRVIHRILAPGGVWINCGPLLWHWENTDDISIEVSLEEVKALATQVGFEIKNEHTINTSYVGDEQSMLGYVYKAAFWTATRVER
ncbi:hypothetical protein FRC14_001763 [Serendipita sp. 396]|nr:hypothetical protein FRC14_001763 [Serendipita sp. 396]